MQHVECGIKPLHLLHCPLQVDFFAVHPGLVDTPLIDKADKGR